MTFVLTCDHAHATQQKHLLRSDAHVPLFTEDADVIVRTHDAQGMTGPDGKKMTGKLHLVLVMVRGKDKKLTIGAARPYMFLPPPPQASASR